MAPQIEVAIPQMFFCVFAFTFAADDWELFAVFSVESDAVAYRAALNKQPPLRGSATISRRTMPDIKATLLQSAAAQISGPLAKLVERALQQADNPMAEDGV